MDESSLLSLPQQYARVRRDMRTIHVWIHAIRKCTKNPRAAETMAYAEHMLEMLIRERDWLREKMRSEQ